MAVWQRVKLSSVFAKDAFKEKEKERKQKREFEYVCKAKLFCTTKNE